MREGLIEFLIEHDSAQPVSFHVPGHKGRIDTFEKYGYSTYFNNIIGKDITEIPGADDLHDPQGVLKDLMERYADLYGAVKTELLVNGSSVGIIASILSTVPRGGKLVAGSNCHKSVFNAAKLGDIDIIKVNPEFNREFGVEGPVRAEDVAKTLDVNPDAVAVIITSPSYTGFLSDIREISAVVHNRDKILIVDQAHGAHLKFFDNDTRYKHAAENFGADLVINSTHKTLFSFTGSAILNICSDKSGKIRVDIDKIGKMLRMLQTTSPSYLMLASLDMNESIMRRDGKNIVRNWKDDLTYFYLKRREIPELVTIVTDDMDLSKINIAIKNGNIDKQLIRQSETNRSDGMMPAEELIKALAKENIFAEKTHENYVLLVTGAGTRRSDYDALLMAIQKIVQSNKTGD